MAGVLLLAMVLILDSIHPHATASRPTEARKEKHNYSNKLQRLFMMPPGKASNRHPGESKKGSANIVDGSTIPNIPSGTELRIPRTNEIVGQDHGRDIPDWYEFRKGTTKPVFLGIQDTGGTAWMNRQRKLPLIQKLPNRNPNSTSKSLSFSNSDSKAVRLNSERRMRRDDVGRGVAGPLLGSVPNILPSLLPPLKPTTTTERPISLTPTTRNTAKPRSVPVITVQPIDAPDPDLSDVVQDEGANEIAPEPWPEPGPDWTTAYMYLGVAWFIHIYGFAVLMFLIAIIAMFTLIEIFATKTVTQRGLSTSLNCLLFLFGLSRGVSLIVNPYGSLERISLLASRLAWSVGFPCLTSMLTTLLLVLVDTTKVSLGPPRFQQFHIVIKLSATHFIIVLGTDIVLSFYLQLKALLLVCQLVYVIWSILLTVGYYRVGYLIARNFRASRHSTSVHDRAAQRLEKLIFGCGTVALCNCVTHLYGAAGVFGVYSDLTFVPAWPWWVFQTLMRLEEIAMCFIVLALAGKSKHDCKDEGGKTSFMYTCWRRVKSYGPCFPMKKRDSREELTNEEGGRDVANAGESWSTYGTNAPDSSSRSDSRKTSSESAMDKRSRSSSESINSKSIEERKPHATPRTTGRSNSSRKDCEILEERRASSHAIDGNGKQRKISLKAVIEETPSTSAITQDEPNIQMISKPTGKLISLPEKDARTLGASRRKTLYPSLEDSDLQIPAIRSEGVGRDIQSPVIKPTRILKEEQSSQPGPNNMAVRKSSSLPAKKRPAPNPPKLTGKRTIHPSTEDRNLSTLSRPSVRRPRPMVPGTGKSMISSISTTHTPHRPGD